MPSRSRKNGSVECHLIEGVPGVPGPSRTGLGLEDDNVGAPGSGEPYQASAAVEESGEGEDDKGDLYPVC